MENFTIKNKTTNEILTLNIHDVYVISQDGQPIEINYNTVRFNSFNEIYQQPQEHEHQLYLSYLELNDIKKKNKIDLTSQIAFYVSTGKKDYNNKMIYDLYLTPNEIKVYFNKSFKKDMGDSIWTYNELEFTCQYDLKLMISDLSSLVLSEQELINLYPNYRIDNVSEIGEIITNLKEWLVNIDDETKQEKLLKKVEILENYIKEGKTLIYHTYKNRLINSFKYNKFVESQYKDYVIESDKICKELKEKFGINLDSYALIKLYRNGYKIVKTRK